jgi:hypothetical protein
MTPSGRSPDREEEALDAADFIKPPAQRPGPRLSWLTPVYILLLVWTGKAGWDAWQAWRSLSWPSVEGVVAQAKSTGRTGFVLDVRYRPASGGEFLCRRIRFGMVGPTASIRRRYGISRGAAGGEKPAAVRYHPERPALSVLEPGLHWNGIGLEALYLLSAWYFALVMPRLLATLGPLPSRRTPPWRPF